MIRFYSADVPIPVKGRALHKMWLKANAEKRGFAINELNYIFCSDEYLLEMNKQYLNHDYYTDIITFPLSVEEGKVHAECYLSIDRIKENAQQNGVTFAAELRRVMVHGLLHLVGEDDKSAALAESMQRAETEALSNWLFHVERNKQSNL